VFAMTFNMTLPMVALMRYRGHGWERCVEMAAAMFAWPSRCSCCSGSAGSRQAPCCRWRWR
jgi:hypothetical protein